MAEYRRRDPSDPRSPWYIDFTYDYPDGTKERIRKTSKHEAVRAVEKQIQLIKTEMQKRFEAGTHKKDLTPTLAEFAPRLLEEAEQRKNKHSMKVQKASSLRTKLIPAFGELPLDEITSARVKEFIARELAAPTRRGKAPSHSTVNSHLRVLSRLLHLAVEDGKLMAVPHFRLLKEDSSDADISEDEYLTDGELKALLAGAPEAQLRTMVLVAARTGLRIGELLALRWENVDLGSGQLAVRATVWQGVEGPPKGNRTRVVPLSSDALAALKAFRHLRGPYVFPDLSYDSALRQLVALAEATGSRKILLPYAGWHTLRHTFCSHLAQRGNSIFKIQELAGHTDVKVTKRYAHLSPDVKRAAVESLVGP
jgi:integrase